MSQAAPDETRSVRYGLIASDHVVQFHTSEQLAASAIATFIANRWDNGDQFLVVARASRWRAVTSLLARQKSIAMGIGMGLGVSERLTYLDADRTLDQIMRNGMPDATLFDAVLGRLVTRLTRGGSQVRVYGELVDLLAEQDNFDAVHALEARWNALGGTHAFTLVCGYSPKRFSGAKGRDELQAVCSAHARVLPS